MDPQSETFNFLGLPKEIRLQIYELLLTTLKNHVFQSTTNEQYNNSIHRIILASESRPTAILLTCRTITSEATPYIRKLASPPRIIITPGNILTMDGLKFIIHRLDNEYYQVLHRRSIPATFYSNVDSVFLRTRTLVGVDDPGPAMTFKQWMSKSARLLKEVEPVIEVAILRDEDPAERGNLGLGRWLEIALGDAVVVLSGFGMKVGGKEAIERVRLFVEPVAEIGVEEVGSRGAFQTMREREQEMVDCKIGPAVRLTVVKVPVTVLGEAEWKGGWEAS